MIGWFSGMSIFFGLFYAKVILAIIVSNYTQYKMYFKEVNTSLSKTDLFGP